MADQIDIDQLAEQIKELIPALKRLSGTQTTGSGVAGRDADRIVTAIAKLSAAMDKKTIDEKRSMEKFIKSVDSAADAQQEAARKAKESSDIAARAAEEERRRKLSSAELAQEITKAETEARKENNKRIYDEAQARKESSVNYAKRLAEEQISTSRSQGIFRDKLENMAGSSVGWNKAIIMGSEALSKLGASAFSMGKALYEGKQGASANNEALEGLGDAAEKLGAAFGPLGMIIGKIVKWFTGYVVEANKMSDRLYKSYQDLSKVGVTAQDGMIGLAESAQKLGFGLDDAGIENFGKLMKSAAVDLALMSGSAVQGRKDFTEFASGVVRGQAGRELMNLGYSVEQLNEGLASYIALQARVGGAQNKTQAQLQAGATAYLKEMDMLTKLTGIQRQELEEGINKARAVEAFRAKLEDLRAQDREKEAEQMELYYAVLQKQAPRLAQGFAESAAGMIVSPEGRQYFQAIDSGANIVQRLSTGAIDATKALGDTYKQAKLSEEQFRHLAMAMAAGDVVGSYVELADIAKRSGISMEDAAKMIKEAQDAQTKGPGGVAAQTDMRRAQMDSRDALQNLVLKGVNPATNAMSDFASIVSKVTGMLGGPKPKMGEAAAGAAPAGGGTAGGGAAAGGGTAGGGAAGGAAPPEMPGTITGNISAGMAGAKGGGVFGAIGRALGGGAAPTAGGETAAGGAGMRPAPEPGAAASLPKLRELIASVESRGDYNVVVGGAKYPLTTMTISEVLSLQKKLISEGKDSAAGKYQIKYSTLADIMGKAGVGLDAKFDQSTQDKLADALIMRRGFDQYSRNPTQESKERFLANLAKEWAGLPSGPSGKSYYEGKNGNKAGIGWEQALASFGTGGIARGPKSGYSATLHGTEAVVPLPDGKSIPVDIKGLTKQIRETILGLPDDAPFMSFGGLNTEGGYSVGPLQTYDSKLTNMIMERLGLSDMKSKREINLSGIGTNYQLGEVTMGSRMGGGFLQGEIADRVAKLVEEGQPLQKALENTTAEMGKFMEEFTRMNADGGREGMIAMIDQLREMVSLQRQNNSTQSRILQVSQN